MTVKQVYDVITYAVAKNSGQGYVSPDEFNEQIMPVAEQGYLDFLLGEYQKYQIKRPIAVVEFGQNERIRTSLAPLIYGTILNIDGTGLSPFPSDFQGVDSMSTVYGLYNIKFVQQDRQVTYRKSVIDPVATNPIYLIKHEGFQFYPEDTGQAELSYVRKIPFMKYGYQLDGNGLPVYNAALSTQPIWPDTDIYQVIVRALALVGVNLQIGVVMQYANDIKNTGQ